MFRALIQSARLTWHVRRVRKLQARARALGYSVLPSDLVSQAQTEAAELYRYCERSGFLTTRTGARPRARSRIMTGLARVVGLLG